jgi:hypothetical protein
MSRDQNAGRSHNIKTDSRYFERVEEFKYLGTTLTNQNFAQEEIKNRLKSEISCYHSVENLLSSGLLSKILIINICRTIISETWSVALREERRLRVFENRVLRGIFGPKRDEVTGDGGNYILWSLMICNPHPILCG